MRETIINTYDQNVAAGGTRIVIYHFKSQRMYSARLAVTIYKDGATISTDPGAHWSDYGRKTFVVSHYPSKAVALAAVIAWITEKFGAREFVRNRMGDYVEKEVNQKFPIPKRD